MKIIEAVVEDAKLLEEEGAERKSLTRLSSEFNVNDRVWIRPLKKIGQISELPTYRDNNFKVKLDEDGTVVPVNWYNIFFEEEKEKYNFQPAPIEEKVEADVLKTS